MCGFCGIHAPFGISKGDSEAIVGMTALMAERGPDAESFYRGRELALGHRRLKIIDLETGDQPVYNEDRSVLVMYNGEIFNYREIRRELEGRGHRFRTRSDTEVIVHAYEEYGSKCVEHFRGMFAFALHDLRTNELFLARDRLGIKPLYYCLDGERLLFASEIKPLLFAVGGRATPDPVAIDFFTSLGYVPGERTAFQRINKLLPGHYMVRSGRRLTIARYWDVPDEPQHSLSLDDAQERFAELLRESVRLRLISDVPLGAFLSGGVDSSVIVAQMRELASGPIRTFSIGYEDSPEHNELPYAREVASHLGTEHVEHVLTHGDFFANMEAFVTRSEEPIVESAGIALYELARRARRDVKVVLSGEGGDEVLAGYPLYRIMSQIERVHPLVRWSGAGALGRALSRRVSSEKFAKYLDWTATPLKERYWSIPNDVTSSIRARMYTDDFLQVAGARVGEYFQELYAHLPSASPLKRMSYVDIKSWLPDDLLIKADKMTMAASVELRVPFLDHELLEFCLSLPDAYRLNGAVGKFLLKRLARRWLPESILTRKKQGFPVPISRWFREDLHDRIVEILLDPRTLGRGYFRPQYVREVLAKHKAGAGDYGRRLLTLVILEIWHRTYADSACWLVRKQQRADLGVARA